MQLSYRGFTLIELIVVIALIGLFSAITLVSLGQVRINANETAIKANLATIQTEAEIYAYNNSNTYGTGISSGKCDLGSRMVTLDTTIATALQAISKIEGCSSLYNCTSVTPAKMTCNVCNIVGANPCVGYAIEVELPSGGYWCIDSTGANKYRSTSMGVGARNDCQS